MENKKFDDGDTNRISVFLKNEFHDFQDVVCEMIKTDGNCYKAEEVKTQDDSTLNVAYDKDTDEITATVKLPGITPFNKIYRFCHTDRQIYSNI